MTVLQFASGAVRGSSRGHILRCSSRNSDLLKCFGNQILQISQKSGSCIFVRDEKVLSRGSFLTRDS